MPHPGTGAYILTVTGLDWAIIAFALLMAAWGYRQGLIVGALSMLGFAVGGLLGSRLGPELLVDGSESPYAPVIALAGALLIGGVVAVSLESIAHGMRVRLLGRSGPARAIDAAGGALLLAALGIGLVWLFGAVALNAPGAKDLRRSVQGSAVLKALNEEFPPSGDLLNALNRIDPGNAISGPDPGVKAPDSSIAGDPEVRTASASVVRVLGTACGLGVSGSGWVVAPGLIVTNAHVVAGQDDTSVAPEDEDPNLDALPVHYDPSNDLALLRVDGFDAPPLPLASPALSGTPGAVVGYPANGPLAISPARLGSTGGATTEDSYGNGPLRRSLTALRGEVLSGNSGGPVIDGSGQVLTTVFASTESKQPGGYGVPNAVVSSAVESSGGEVDTGPCTR